MPKRDVLKRNDKMLTAKYCILSIGVFFKHMGVWLYAGYTPFYCGRADGYKNFRSCFLHSTCYRTSFMSSCIPDYEAISFRKMLDEYVIKEQSGDKE